MQDLSITTKNGHTREDPDGGVLKGGGLLIRHLSRRFKEHTFAVVHGEGNEI